MHANLGELLRDEAARFNHHRVGGDILPDQAEWRITGGIISILCLLCICAELRKQLFLRVRC